MTPGRNGLLGALATCCAFTPHDVVAEHATALGSPVPIGASGGIANRTLPSGDIAILENLGGFPSRVFQILSGLQPDRVATRGTADARLFARLSPSVVIIVTDQATGSGSIVEPDGQILTSWHVIAGAKQIGVIYKPTTGQTEPTRADVRAAKLVRVDEISDLALLEVVGPRANRTSIPVGTLADLSVGDDVNAIGHPNGEAWTYTKGIVSQIRQKYEWSTESGVSHRADVVQTQTPINPGNSGGPLLTEQGLLIGVNSFIEQGQGLNFAVAVTDVERLLSSKSDRLAKRKTGDGLEAARTECEVHILEERRLSDEQASATVADTNCDNRPDTLFVTPDSVIKPLELRIDSNADGTIDVIILDFDRDGRWDDSFADTDGDGSPDVRGFHPDGSASPSRVEPYDGK